MNILFDRPSTPEAAAIRERIFNVLPAASYQMEKLSAAYSGRLSRAPCAGAASMPDEVRLFTAGR
jgi:hypothetical protein